MIILEQYPTTRSVNAVNNISNKIFNCSEATSFMLNYMISSSYVDEINDETFLVGEGGGRGRKGGYE